MIGTHRLAGGYRLGPMPFLLGVTMFFVLLASAAALSLADAAERLEGSGRLTVQVLAPVEARREAETDAALKALKATAGVQMAHRVGDQEMRSLLEAWMGKAGIADLPLPALIEVELGPEGRAEAAEAAVSRAAPSAVVNADQQWLRPVAKLVSLLRWLAAVVVLVASAAAVAATIWAALSELEAQRDTVGLLHLMGATDRQITRLFERRIALGALVGGAIGLVAALPVLLLVGSRLAALDSGFIGSDVGASFRWLLLLVPPLAGAFLAMLVARATLLRALKRV